MAETKTIGLGEDDDRADLRTMPPVVFAVGLIPPRPGVAVDLDARRGTREGHALADVIEQRSGMGRKRCAERGGDQQRRRREAEGATAGRAGAAHARRASPKW